ncbi:molybdate ABC transporter substrate-binding protein [Streptomyces triticirhizae]|uniref:Molybdate ABC transporter substrate-binding protein n=1 Tax=Streptomyces triticirhizae TaxID=2483353 RepID=A0A3M2LN03_9ACTN|nr:molybdate ABC transporter substrate-binding protein [Streptomyces triticirhizae]RMI36138.1 molybdate ABC transporter substrate-binding protein [Streptomyces triticirhizae]
MFRTRAVSRSRSRSRLVARPRRALAGALLAPAVVLGLAGCGSDDSGDSEDSAGSSNGGGSEVTLTVLAAASLTDVFEEAGAAYEEENPGTTVRFSFAGSQELVAQLDGGAPADVLVTADTDTMASAAELTGEPSVIARNELTIVTPPDNPAGVDELADLADPELRLVLAAPEVPAGRYGQEILTAAGVAAEPDSLEANVRAVLGKVQLGEADAGLVYVTDATVAGDEVHVVPIPEELNVVAEYPAATLNDAEHPEEAAEFVAWLNEEAARGLLAEAGFLVP